jgi:pentapeptide MXKDX repeat protein
MSHRFPLMASAAILVLGLAAAPAAFSQQNDPGMQSESGHTHQRSMNQGMHGPGETGGTGMSTSGMEHSGRQTDTMSHDMMKKDPSKQDKGM